MALVQTLDPELDVTPETSRGLPADSTPPWELPASDQNGSAP